MDMLTRRMIWIKAHWKLRKAPPTAVVDSEKNVHAKREIIISINALTFKFLKTIKPFIQTNYIQHKSWRLSRTIHLTETL